MSDLTEQITLEIAKAIIKLGGNPNSVNLADSCQVNRVLEFLNADAYLMCTVGSWRDTLSDEEVLHDLQAWNQYGSKALKGKSFVR